MTSLVQLRAESKKILREIAILKLSDLNYKEIAEELGMTKGQIKGRVSASFLSAPAWRKTAWKIIGETNPDDDQIPVKIPTKDFKAMVRGEEA